MMNRTLIAALMVSAVVSAPAMAKIDTNDNVHYVKPTAAAQVSAEDVARVWSTAESDHSFRFNAEQETGNKSVAKLDMSHVWNGSESSSPVYPD